MFTAEQSAEIVRRYNNNEHIREIARTVGVDPDTVYRVLYKNGVQLRKTNRKGAPRRFAPAEEQRIVQRTLEGESGSQIARTLGCATKTVYSVLHRHGVKMQRVNVKQTYTKEEQIGICNRYVRDGLSMDAVGREFGVSHFAIETMLRERGIPRRPQDEAGRRYACNHSFFDSVDTERKAYWLGFIAADGNVWQHNLKIALARKDREHLDRYKEHIGSEHPIDDYMASNPNGKPTPQSRVTIKSRQLAASLAKHGILPRKSLTLRWPRHLQSELQQHFLRGYFDGGGSFSVGSGQLQMNLVGTEDVCRAAQDLLVENVGLNRTKLLTPKNSSGVWYVAYGGNKQVPRIAQYLYRGATVWLPRKRAVVEAARV